MAASNDKINEHDSDFATSELESGQFEMKKDVLSLSKRLSYMSLGLNFRCHKLTVKLKEFFKSYFTTKIIEVSILILTSIIVFSILFHKLSQNKTLVIGKLLSK